MRSWRVMGVASGSDAAAGGDGVAWSVGMAQDLLSRGVQRADPLPSVSGQFRPVSARPAAIEYRNCESTDDVVRVVRPCRSDGPGVGARQGGRHMKQLDPRDVVLACDARAALGEGPLWDDRRKQLVFVDITGQRVHVFDPATGGHRWFGVSVPVGAIGLTAGVDWIAAGGGG